MSDQDARREELRTRLAVVRERIAGACVAAGRPADDVDLLVVTKTFPASDVLLLAGLGCRQAGESRDQEARPKREAVAAAGVAMHWHMIGQVQRNKAKSVTGWADVVESVDRQALAAALAAGALAHGRTCGLLIQVSLDDPPVTGRGGCAPADVPALAEAIAALEGVRLDGVMGVAPFPGDPDRAFELLARVHAQVRTVVPAAGAMSAGMSGDLEQAIRHGATQVRVGGAILGNRPPLR